MNNESFNNNIMSEITNKKMRPRSRWIFITEQWFFVTVTLLATVIGGVAVTTTLFVLTDHDWFAVQYLDEAFATHIIKTIPYVWIAMVIIVILLINRNIKKIGHGYRYASWKIIGLSLLASISIGTTLFFAGAGRYLDNYFDRTIPAYRSVVSSNKDIWVYPESGLLSGKITSVVRGVITITDQDEQIWSLIVTPDTTFEMKNIVVGKWIKITGEMGPDNTFTATRIFPWKNERK